MDAKEMKHMRRKIVPFRRLDMYSVSTQMRIDFECKCCGASTSGEIDAHSVLDEDFDACWTFCMRCNSVFTIYDGYLRETLKKIAKAYVDVLEETDYGYSI